MKLTLLLIITTLTLSGCGWFSRGSAYVTGYSEDCIRGVVYYQFPSGVTVAYNENGTIKTCK